MNGALLRQTWRAQAPKLLVVVVALAIWGSLMPIVYATFGSDFRQIFESGIIPEELAQFGGGDVFSLSGSIALGFIHPIAIAVACVFAVGFPTSAIAGERQRGTLEVLLARPLSRRTVYATDLVSAFGFVAVAIAGLLVGALLGSAVAGVAGELDLANLPLAWLNAVLLFGAIAAIGLAASVSFDRLTPALGVTLGVVVVMYFLDVLGSLWPDAKVLQPYSLFHYFQPKAVLTGAAEPFDFGLLAGVIVLAVGYALVVFPRRDLAAPS
jgi:ABC-2 type transport system permease protein